MGRKAQGPVLHGRAGYRNWRCFSQAALFKATHKMSYADCFAAALAKQKNAELITGDPEFKALEKDIKIVWLK